MEAPVEELGTVSCPSGDLLLLDFGLLRLWSGESPPTLDPYVVPAEVADAANAAGDLEITGPDAAEVATRLDLAIVKGRYAFDVPVDSPALSDLVADLCREFGLRAEVEQIGRMPHRERVRRLLADSPGGAEVPFHGMWAVAVRDLPRDRPLPVRGRRMDPGGLDPGCWHEVWVELGPGSPATSREVGAVLVDEARLMFVDPDALAAWRNDDSSDGLADLVLWGPDAEGTAAEFGADEVPGEGSQFGWLDVPVARALDLGERLEQRRAEGSAAFALDFRPHDDHHRVLSSARASTTGSATVTVGGTEAVGFFTTWGDGAFSVHVDSDAAGAPCRLRVLLGSPDVVRRTRRLEDLWFGELSKAAIASARVAVDGLPVAWLYREAPGHQDDSGWRVFAGDETEEYIDDPENAAIVRLRDLVGADPDLETVLRSPAPAAFERDAGGVFVPAGPLQG